jgi:hypothetical protein
MKEDEYMKILEVIGGLFVLYQFLNLAFGLWQTRKDAR